MKKKTILTLMLATLLPLGLMAQITEPGASEPNQLYTTTYDNPGGPNHGPNRASMSDDDFEEIPDPGNPQPVGAPWALLAFAAAYGVARVLRRRQRD